MFAALRDAWNGLRLIGFLPAIQSLWYAFYRRQQAKRFAEHELSPGEDMLLGALATFTRDVRGVTLHTVSGSLRLDVLTPDCWRVRVSPTNEFPPPFSYSVAKNDWPTVPFTLHETETSLQIRAGDVTVSLARADLAMTVTGADGRIICQDAIGPVNTSAQGVSLALHLPPEEVSHGLGERAFGLNLRGRSYHLWNTNPRNYSPGTDPIYCCTPFYLGLRDELAYGVFWDNPARGRVDVGIPEAPEQLVFSAEAGELRYYLFTGPSALDVLERYTELTGRMALPPLWALGYHQSRWSYVDAGEVRAITREFRLRRIPCDAIYFDIDYMDGFRCFTWDPERFGDHRRLLQDLHRDGFRAVVIIDPGIKVDRRYATCHTGEREDVFVKYPNGELFIAPVWPGNCYFPDFTAPRTRAWWGRQYRSLVKVGVDGFWNDMNEPAIFGPGSTQPHMPTYLSHFWEGEQATHLDAHNVYGMLMARATHEGVAALAPERRPFVITRAGWAGVQRFASSWTGDNSSTWEHLRLSIPMSLNQGLSGLAFTGPDVGGFAENADGELFTRWVQAAALLPFFRGHSCKGTARHEPWSFGQPYEDVCRAAIELRYRLLPYLYTAFADCAAHGWPIVRPLSLLDPAFADCDDQFLLGDHLLVAPVVEQGATARLVRLPEGVWYDYWSGARHAGPATLTVQTPLEMLPLFARAGTVLPHWPVRQYVDAVAVDEVLVLHVYCGDGVTRLYEDAGEGREYQKGVYRWSCFETLSNDTDCTITWTRDGAYVPPYEQVQLVITGLPSPPRAIALDDQPLTAGQYEFGQLRLDVPPFTTLRVQFA